MTIKFIELIFACTLLSGCAVPYGAGTSAYHTDPLFSYFDLYNYYNDFNAYQNYSNKTNATRKDLNKSDQFLKDMGAIDLDGKKTWNYTNFYKLPTMQPHKNQAQIFNSSFFRKR